MAIFNNGSNASRYALENKANAMHIVRYLDGCNEQVTEYWIKDADVESKRFSRNLAYFIEDRIVCDKLMEYTRINFDI